MSARKPVFKSSREVTHYYLGRAQAQRESTLEKARASDDKITRGIYVHAARAWHGMVLRYQAELREVAS